MAVMLTGRVLAESLRVGADLEVADLRVVRIGRHEVCRTWKLWGSRGYVGWSCRRSASSQDLLFLRGVDQSTAHQSWELCSITIAARSPASRRPRCPELKLLQLLTRTTSGRSGRSLAVSSAALLGGELS
jgi:hypothetical protein